MAAEPLVSLFRIRIFCSRGSLTPVAAPNVFFGGRPDSNQCIPIPRLIDVAWRPNIETGANLPGYSGGGAAGVVVTYSASLIRQPWWLAVAFAHDEVE